MKYVCRYLERYEHYMNTIQQYVINDGMVCTLIASNMAIAHEYMQVSICG